MKPGKRGSVTIAEPKAADVYKIQFELYPRRLSGLPGGLEGHMIVIEWKRGTKQVSGVTKTSLASKVRSAESLYRSPSTSSSSSFLVFVSIKTEKMEGMCC